VEKKLFLFISAGRCEFDENFDCAKEKKSNNLLVGERRLRKENYL